MDLLKEEGYTLYKNLPPSQEAKDKAKEKVRYLTTKVKEDLTEQLLFTSTSEYTNRRIKDEPFKYVPENRMFRTLQSPPNQSSVPCAIFNAWGHRDPEYKTHKCKLTSGHYNKEAGRAYIHACSICLSQLQLKMSHAAADCPLLKVDHLTRPIVHWNKLR